MGTDQHGDQKWEPTMGTRNWGTEVRTESRYQKWGFFAAKRPLECDIGSIQRASWANRDFIFHGENNEKNDKIVFMSSGPERGIMGPHGGILIGILSFLEYGAQGTRSAAKGSR